MTETEEATPTRRRTSPGYPALDLRNAIDRTLDLYKASPKHPVPLGVAAELWGFSSRSSSSKVTAAALKRFGLVRDVGGGTARQLALTDEGREIAFYSDDRESERWTELLQGAALAPKIHRQVIDHFGIPLPDERVVLRYLLFELGFQDESTARDFLKRLTSTLRFAGVGHIDPEGAAAGAGPHLAVGALRPQSDLPVAPPSEQPEMAVSPSPQVRAANSQPAATLDNVQSTGGAEQAQPAGPESPLGHTRPSVPVSDRVWRAPEAGSAESHEPVRPPRRWIYDHFRADRKAVQIPYSNGQWAVLEAAFPLTEAEWTMLTGVLQAMKPGLVVDPESRGDDEED